MGARYYSGDSGRFTSQDPLVLALGSQNEIETIINGPYAELFKHPQTLNSYSYTANNPVKYTDPTGEGLPIAALLAYAFTVMGVVDVGTSAYERYLVSAYPDAFSESDKTAANQKLVVNTAKTVFGSYLSKADETAGLTWDATGFIVDQMVDVYAQIPEETLDNVTTPSMLPSTEVPLSEPTKREEVISNP